jgi:uncharacterized membrane protein
MQIALSFAFLYIVIDICYVTLSLGAYKGAIGSFPSPSRLWSAVLAWICMFVGWYFLVAPTAIALMPKYGLLAGAFAGFIYGLAVYGTFNFTNAAMLQKWYGSIMIRDLIWGVGWVTLLTFMFTYVISRRTERVARR